MTSTHDPNIGNSLLGQFAKPAGRQGRCLLRTLLLLVVAIGAVGVICYSVGILGEKVDKETWNELLPPQLQFDTKKQGTQHEHGADKSP